MLGRMIARQVARNLGKKHINDKEDATNYLKVLAVTLLLLCLVNLIFAMCGIELF